MDVFIEKIITRRKTLNDRLIVGAAIVGGAILALASFSIPYINTFSLIVIAGIGYGVYLLTSSRNIEFEYAVTNGELDIDKIISQRKRKRIFTGNCKEFDIVAPKNSIHFSNDIKNIAKRIESVSHMESEDVYFIVANYKGEKTVVFFEPDRRMLDSFKAFIPRKVFEK